MSLEPPPGQGPVDPRGAFTPPPPPPPGSSPAGEGQAPAPAAPAGSVPDFNRPVVPTTNQAGPSQPQAPPTPRPPVSAPTGAWPQPPQVPPPAMYPAPMMRPPMGFNPAFFPPPPPPRPAGALRFLGMTFLFLLLFGSVAANIVLLLGGLGRGASVSNSIINGDPHEVIAVVGINGIITDSTADRFNRQLTPIEQNANVKALVVEVNTPGGAVAPSDAIYHRLLQFKRTNRPIIVAMGGLATSGGYYISCAADWVIAQPMTLTGNVGVIMPRYNVSKLAEKWGIEESTVTAPAKGFKNAGSMFAPRTKEEDEYWQNLIDGAYKRFTRVVSEGRKNALTESIEKIANGKVYDAGEALNLGLIDDTGYADDAYKAAQKWAGLRNPTVIKYREIPSLLDLFEGSDSTYHGGGGKAAAVGGAGSVTINGIQVNVDPELIQSLRTPRLMYLWQGNESPSP